jgi:hypothetical protein
VEGQRSPSSGCAAVGTARRRPERAPRPDVSVDRPRQARRGIRAIDAVLDAVERHHLARRPRFVAPLPAWIARLEREGGLSVPSHILRSRDTVQLHGALMDWQDELLTIARPGRTQLTRADEPDEDDKRRRRT